MLPTEKYEILLVDDEPDLRETLAIQFALLKSRTSEASHGKEAIEVLKKARASGRQVDVIISDLNMPHMNGLEFLREIRNLGFVTPVVFFTGYGDKEKAIEAFRLGATDFLEKPFSPEVLNEIVLRAAELGRKINGLDQNMKALGQNYKVPEEELIKIRQIHQELVRGYRSK